MKEKINQAMLDRLKELREYMLGPDGMLWWLKLEIMLKNPPKKNANLRFQQATSVVMNDGHWPSTHKLLIITVFNLGFGVGGNWKEIVEKIKSSKKIKLCEGSVAVDFALRGGIPEGMLVIPVRAHNFDCVIAPPLESPWGHHTWFEYTVEPSETFSPTEMFVVEINPLSEDLNQKAKLAEILSDVLAETLTVN